MNTPEIHAGKYKRAMKLSVIRSMADFAENFQRSFAANEARNARELDLLNGQKSGFLYQGYCRVCDEASQFRIDFHEIGFGQDRASQPPNWRETLTCKSCHLNNRLRFAVDSLKHYLKLHVSDKIYLTEQLTPLFSWMKRHYPHTVGSEFLDPHLLSGTLVGNLRHEDLTALSFEDDSLDFIISFDVLEHVPNYHRAFAECVRCLKEGGKFVFSVPFRADSYETLIRAKIDENGSIVHLLPPEYHGNPTQPENGILCFYHFGWDILDELRRMEVTDVYMLSGHSSLYGNLGPEQLLFIATK